MDFVILANAWSAAVDNPTSKHQIALELVRRGHRVLWLEGAGMRKPSLGSGTDRRKLAAKVKSLCRGVRAESAMDSTGQLWVRALPVLPLPGYALVRRINSWLAWRIAVSLAHRLDLDRPVFLNYVPVFAELMKTWKKRADSSVIYHCVDRWDAFGAYDRDLMTALDADCCRQADVVIASSTDLMERCRRHNANTHLVTHGVNYTHFAAALQQDNGRRNTDDGARTIGFFGLISEWVDQDLLVRLAQAVPDSSIVLIGKADVDVAGLRAVPNIRLLGPKSFVELPAYVTQFDVGIIPFVVNDLTRAVNPIKLREMLAAGCPVVSTALPEVEGWQEREDSRLRQGYGGHGSQRSETCPASLGVRDQRQEDRQPATNNSATQQPDNHAPKAVSIARDADEFVRLVRERVANPLSSTERQRISDSVREETWEAKVSQILALVG